MLLLKGVAVGFIRRSRHSLARSCYISSQLRTGRFPHKRQLSMDTPTEVMKGCSLSDVVSALEKIAPLHLAEDWDNVGLLVEPSDPQRIATIFLTNDLTEPVLEEAISLNANFIVSYHPPIFVPLKSLTTATFKERVILKAIEAHIAVYSPHTALDAVGGGVNDWLAAGVGEGKVKPLSLVETEPHHSKMLLIQGFGSEGESRNCLEKISSEIDQMKLSNLQVAQQLEGIWQVTLACDKKTVLDILSLTASKPELSVEMKSAISTKTNVERNCGLTEYQPRTTGILSVVDMYDSVIIAGYSSGAVCMWDLTVDSEPIEMSQPPGDAAGSQPSCATVRGNVVAVGTKGGPPVDVIFSVSSIGIIKIFNTYGLSQEHEITCPHKEPVTHISSAAIDQSPFIAASFGVKKYMVIWGSHDNQWHFKIFPPKDPHDGPIEDIFTVGLQREQDPSGVVVCHRNRISLQTLNGDCIDVVTSTDLHSSVYFTSHSNTLLGRVDVRESSAQLAWGSGVKSCEAIKIYDYTRGLISQSISCRQRHVVTALNFGESPPNMVVSGNTDYKVMVHDIRSPDAVVMVLKGHDDVITDVQMDDWKVTSGSNDGSSVVWDQRMCSLLWQTNARHPVRNCRFQGNYLVTANIPINTNPDLVYGNYDWEPLGARQRSIPTRYLGLLRVFDFSVDPLHYSKVLPSICSSAYNEPAASNYNMDLIVPYDDIVDQDVM